MTTQPLMAIVSNAAAHIAATVLRILMGSSNERVETCSTLAAEGC